MSDEQKTYQEEVTRLSLSIQAKIGKPKLHKWIEDAVDRGGNRNNSKVIKFRTAVETHLDLATLTDVKGAEKQAEMYLKEVKNDVEVDDAEAHKTRNVLYCRMSDTAKRTPCEMVEINGKAVGGLSVNQSTLAYAYLQHGTGCALLRKTSSSTFKNREQMLGWELNRCVRWQHWVKWHVFS